MHRTLRERSSLFFHATTPFSQVWQILFHFDLAFCDILTKPESMELAKGNTKKLINNGKTPWLAKKFQDPVFCVFLLPSTLPCLNFAAFLSWSMPCPCVIILSFLNTTSLLMCIFGQILIKCCVSSPVNRLSPNSDQHQLSPNNIQAMSRD